MNYLFKNLKNYYFKIFIISFLIKIAYFIFTLLLYKSGIVQEKFGLHLDNFLFTFFRNDAGWYKNIIDYGYSAILNKEELKGIVNGAAIQSEWAFFPLYPYLIKFIMLSGLDYFVSAFLFTLIISTLCFIAFFEFADYTFADKEKAWFTTQLFIFFPFNYYYSMYYTESLFVFLMLSGFLCVSKNKNSFLYLIIPALVLTRPNGLLVSFVLFIFSFEILIKNKKISPKLFFNKAFIYSILPFILAPITMLFYCLYQFKMTGDYFAFNSAQEGWGKENMYPWQALFRHGDFVNQFESIFTCVVLFFFGFFFKKYRFSYILLILFTILIPLSKGSVISMPRYISILFPIFFMVGEKIFNYKYKYFIVGSFFILQLCNLYFWLNFHYFSY